MYLRLKIANGYLYASLGSVTTSAVFHTAFGFQCFPPLFHHAWIYEKIPGACWRRIERETDEHVYRTLERNNFPGTSQRVVQVHTVHAPGIGPTCTGYASVAQRGAEPGCWELR